jgi:lysophospholipase L1-like esterase
VIQRALVAVLICLLGASLAAAPFRDGDRVVFLGDSITHAGGYLSRLSDFYLTRYPDRAVRIVNAGVAGDNVHGALARFDEDVARFDPTVLAFMFGMNDSWRNMYEPAKMADRSYRDALPRHETACLNHFTNGVGALLARARTSIPSARLVFMTPTPYDETCTASGAVPLVGTVAALRRFSVFLRGASTAHGADRVDFFGACQELTEREQAKNPAFSFVGDDRVHPEAPGHLYMAAVFLEAQGVSGAVSDTALSAADGTVTRSENVRVSGFARLPDGCAFTLTAGALPWPIPADARAALAWTPFLGELRRERLSVADLPEGRYALAVDGTEVGAWTADEWKAGVDLGDNPKTPQYREAAALAAANARCADVENALRDLAASRWFLRQRGVDPDDRAAVQAYCDGLDAQAREGYFERGLLRYLGNVSKRPELEADLEARRAALHRHRRPAARRYEIRAVSGRK